MGAKFCMALYVVLNFLRWTIGSQWRDWQRGTAGRTSVSKVDELVILLPVCRW